MVYPKIANAYLFHFHQNCDTTLVNVVVTDFGSRKQDIT